MDGTGSARNRRQQSSAFRVQLGCAYLTMMARTRAYSASELMHHAWQRHLQRMHEAQHWLF